jgi:transposase
MIHTSRDVEEVRRATGLLNLMNGASVSEVALRLAAARSTVYRWVSWYQRGGLEALRSARRGRLHWTVTDALVEAMLALLKHRPQALGYLRSTWSSELLAVALRERHGLHAHPSTLRRLLRRLAWGWRRARPTLHRRDPHKAERLAAIARALAARDPHTEVFFVDEADVDLNPRIGFAWQPRGHQLAVPTPGVNRKHYVAGALHAHTGRVVWAMHPRKNTVLFLKLLEALRRTYRRARRLVLIADNYIIHKSRLSRQWLAQNPKFELLFQPAWHPWVNRIERLWKQLHDTVTRNHRCRSLDELLQQVARFLHLVQPFPGAGHGVAQFGSAI